MRAAVSGIVVAGAILAAVLWGPLSLPTWAVILFAVALIPMIVMLSVKRYRQERRVARTFWDALTGKPQRDNS